MNLLELYALTSGKRIKKQEPLKKYFPLSFDRYITFQPFSKSCKNYDNWIEVLKLIGPALEKNDIKIVQIGGPNEPALLNCFYTQGATNINQVSYLVSKSLLNLSTDSFTSHLAGIYDVPLVCLYSNNYSKNCGPFFGDKSKQILLEPDRKKFPKPSYSYEENPKSINSIKPEKIVSSVLKLLNISFQINFETVYIGERYNQTLFEVVPDQVVDLRQLNAESCGYRMDLSFNEENLQKQLNIGNVAIVTNKPINPNLLVFFKPRITEILYEITESHDVNFVEYLHANGFRYYLFSYLPDEVLNDIKLHYFDYNLIVKKEIKKPDEIKNYDINNLYYKSNRYLLSEGKIYLSENDWKEKRNISTFQENLSKVVDDNSFWKDIERFYLLNKI